MLPDFDDQKALRNWVETIPIHPKILCKMYDLSNPTRSEDC